MPPPRFSCWICTFTSSTQTALTTHLRRTHSFRLNPPHRPRYHASNGNNSSGGSAMAASAAIINDSGRYVYGVRVAGQTVAGPASLDCASNETSVASMAKPYCPGVYVCQVCKFRSPTGAGLARHAYSHQKLAVCATSISPVQPRGAAYSQGLNSIVVRELPVNNAGHTKTVLYTQQIQPLATATTTHQSPYAAESVRVGVPLDAPILLSEGQQQLQEPVQIQDQASVGDGELDPAASLTPISSDPCPECGCAANGKCGLRTPEPGRILLVSQENLAEVTDPSRPQELYELGADALQPLGGLDPTYIEHVHCEEGLLELHYKPPNTTKTIHLTAVRVNQLSCPQEDDIDEQRDGVEENDVGGEISQERVGTPATERKAESQGDDDNTELTSSHTSNACFNSGMATKSEAVGDVEQDAIIQQQMETGDDGAAGTEIPTAGV